MAPDMRVNENVFQEEDDYAFKFVSQDESEFIGLRFLRRGRFEVWIDSDDRRDSFFDHAVVVDGNSIDVRGSVIHGFADPSGSSEDLEEVLYLALPKEFVASAERELAFEAFGVRTVVEGQALKARAFDTLFVDRHEVVKDRGPVVAKRLCRLPEFEVVGERDVLRTGVDAEVHACRRPQSGW